MAIHTHAWKRHKDWTKALRKQHIIQASGFDYYNNLHQYSKNKIHCSCPMCRPYGLNKGNQEERKKLSERKQEMALQDQLNELYMVF